MNQYLYSSFDESISYIHNLEDKNVKGFLGGHTIQDHISIHMYILYRINIYHPITHITTKILRTVMLN